MIQAYPTHVFLFDFMPMSMCIYRAVDRKTHKIVKTGLCTECGVSVLRTLVLNRRFDSEEQVCPVVYLHSEQGRLLYYTLSLAGTCVHLEWFTMVIVIIRKSLYPPPTSGLLNVAILVFLVDT